MLCTAFANVGTFRAATAAIADGFHTVSANVATIAPAVSFAALLANFTIGTEVFVTVIAVLSAIRADYRTATTAVSTGTNVIGALITGLAVFTEVLFPAHAVNTGIASAANILVCAVGTFFKTVLANGCTFRAAVSAVTNVFYTVTAIATLCAPAVPIGAVHATVTVSAEVIVAVVAVLPAVLANDCTFRATVAVIADRFHTVSANVAVVTPAVIAYTSLAQSAIGTQISRTVSALLGTPFTNLGALRAAFSTDTYISRTIDTGAASGAEISFSANTVNTGIAATANILFFTVCTFFVTFRAYGRAIRAPFPANTGGHTFSAGITVRAPAGIPDTTDAEAAIGTEHTRAVLALLAAPFANGRTAIATATALTDHDTSAAASAIGAPAVILLGTVFTHNAA